MKLTRRRSLVGAFAVPLLVACMAIPTEAAQLFALVNTGEVFVSGDQGVSWTAQATIPVRDAVALQARLTATDLFMASASGSIYRSTDAGLNWSAVGAPPVVDLVDMTIRSDGDIVILTASGDVYSSDDLGATFTAQATLTASNFTSLTGRNDGRLFALTRTGEVYLSTDGGVSWVASGVITTSGAVRIRSAGTTLHVVTSTGDFYRSTDTGATWTGIGTISQVGTVAMAVDGGTLIVATQEGHVATSPDGVSWTWKGSANQLYLTALGTDTPVVTGVEEPTTPQLILGAPRPNPARSGAVMSLEFTLSSPDVVTLRLVDVSGRLVAERSPVAYPEGANTVVWDPQLRHSGVYFVRIETEQGLIETRRWVITR